MTTEIDKKLNLFYERTSPRFRDESIWKEVFDIALSYEHTDPQLYFQEIKRLRDLKNTYDYAKEEAAKKREREKLKEKGK